MSSSFVYVTLTLFGWLSHTIQLDYLNYVLQSLPLKYYYSRFGLFRVRSPLLAESHLISFPRPT